MERRRGFCLVLCVALLGQAFAVPLQEARLNREEEMSWKGRGLQNTHDLFKKRSANSDSQSVLDNNINGNSKEDDAKPAESSPGGKTESTTSGPDFDSDEDDDDFPPPASTGGGGGSNIFGLLKLANAFFPSSSGGEDGQSDLGSLLAAVSGIVGNLSGDGFDLNALIASGLGLFVGILSQGDENPGAVIASYLLTSLETITEGGAKNNGAYFGSFLSTLIRGISAGEQPDGSSEEGKEPEKDSAGFIKSFLMALLGEMSKGSFGGSSSSSSSHHPAAEELNW